MLFTARWDMALDEPGDLARSPTQPQSYRNALRPPRTRRFPRPANPASRTAPPAPLAPRARSSLSRAHPSGVAAGVQRLGAASPTLRAVLRVAGHGVARVRDADRTRGTRSPLDG